MLASRRVRLIPNKEQEQWLTNNCGVARFIYNHALALKMNAYEEDGANLTQKELMREITDMKYTYEYDWLQSYSSETIKQAVKDMLQAYSNFFKRGNKGFPKFKKKGKCNESFYVRYDRIYSVNENHIKFPSLDTPIKISEPLFFSKGTVKNPRVSFDGKYWYLSVSYEVQPLSIELTDNVIGVDLGVKNLAILSDGIVFKNINKSDNVIKLERRKQILQRKISRMYEKNKRGNQYIKTNNIKKLERKLRLLNRKLSNIRKTYIHQVTMQIVKTKPSCIVMEDLNIRGMLKNHHIAKALQEQLLYFFRQCIEYKSKYYGGIQFKLAPRKFPSSKKCSNCGNIKKFLSLSERTYVCECCGLVIDRDLNAAINLKNLAYS